MPYRNAETLLPPELVAELQKYISGELVYVPRPPQRRVWGAKNGTRERLRLRNAEIRSLRDAGRSVDELAEQYFLSADAIRKILYAKPRPAEV